jgi:hypothetical protein
MRKSRNFERDVRMTFRVLKGASYKAAGKSIGVSADRALQITKRILRMCRHPKYGETRASPRDTREIRLDAEYWRGRVNIMCVYIILKEPETL